MGSAVYTCIFFPVKRQLLIMDKRRVQGMLKTYTKSTHMFDWSKYISVNTLTQNITAMQNQPTCLDYHFVYSGFGSNLHVWANAMCEAYEQNVAFRAVLPWIWTPQPCPFQKNRDADAFNCLFGKQLKCNTIRPATNNFRCSETSKFNPNNAIDYLFQKMPRAIVRRAADEMHTMFGTLKPDVTVHIRWGDKWKEAVIQPIEKYINATHATIAANNLSKNISVFLTTEDPLALQYFKKKSPPEWKVFCFTPAVSQYSSYDHSPMNDARRTQGSSGLYSIISLLIALESRFFVLSQSNWSNLIKELLDYVKKYKSPIIEVGKGCWPTCKRERHLIIKTSNTEIFVAQDRKYNPTNIGCKIPLMSDIQGFSAESRTSTFVCMYIFVVVGMRDTQR